MSFDLDPLELVACSLLAVLMSVPIAFPLAAGIIAGPRRAWSGAGLAMGVSLLLGVVLAVAAVFIGPGALQTLSGIGLTLGLLCAIAAAVLVIVHEDGNTLAIVLGVIACVLIGLGEPGETVVMMLALSTSTLVVLSSVVIGAVGLVAIVGFLVAVAGRVRALQIGVAVAAIVAALISAFGMLTILLYELAGTDLPQMPLTATLITVLVALVLGSVVGGVLELTKARRGSRPLSAVPEESRIVPEESR